LITAGEMAIEHLKNQNSKTVSVDGCQRMPLDRIPTTFDNLWRCIASCIGDKAAVCLCLISMQFQMILVHQMTDIYDGVVLLH
jgi:hypothetical protein